MPAVGRHWPSDDDDDDDGDDGRPAQLSYDRRADGANRRPQAANIDFSGDDDIDDDDDDDTGLDIFNCNTLTEIF